MFSRQATVCETSLEWEKYPLNDIDYLGLIYDGGKVKEKLREDNLIQIECDPREYVPFFRKQSIWSESVLGDICDEPISNLQVLSGHLFLAEKALKSLGYVLEAYGEVYQ